MWQVIFFCLKGRIEVSGYYAIIYRMLLKTLKKEIMRRLLGEIGIPKLLKRAKFILKHPQLAKTSVVIPLTSA